MGKESEQVAEEALESFKQQVFASAFGSFDPKWAFGEYDKIFEKGKADEEEGGEDFEVEEFEPESEDDVLAMLNAARRAGAIT